MTEEIRILTVRQPWAWAIIHGGKNVENRVRNIAGDYRGPVAIHVAKAVARIDYGSYLQVEKIGYNSIADQHLGEIIGVVDLIEVHNSESCIKWGPVADGVVDHSWCSPWSMSDHQHLVLANPRPLTEPIPYRGALGLRRLGTEIIARINEQIG